MIGGVSVFQRRCAAFLCWYQWPWACLLVVSVASAPSVSDLPLSCNLAASVLCMPLRRCVRFRFLWLLSSTWGCCAAAGRVVELGPAGLSLASRLARGLHPWVVLFVVPISVPNDGWSAISVR